MSAALSRWWAPEARQPGGARPQTAQAVPNLGGNYPYSDSLSDKNLTHLRTSEAFTVAGQQLAAGPGCVHYDRHASCVRQHYHSRMMSLLAKILPTFSPRGGWA